MTFYSPDFDGVWAALEALGDDEEAIARTLREKGIKGKQKEACACPVANYLAEIFGESSIPEIDEDVKFLGWSLDQRMTMPYQVNDFVEAFDLGEYPDLITVLGEEGFRAA